LASRRSPAQRARSFSAAPHPPRCAMVDFPGHAMVPRPHRSGDSGSGHGPSAPGHDHGVTSVVLGSRPRSVGLPPRSALVRTPAPVLTPPAASVGPSDRGSVPVAVRPGWEEACPAVVLRLWRCGLGPLPRRLVACIDPVLPPRQRPAPRADRVGAPPYPYSDFHTASWFEAAVMHACAGPPIGSPPRSLLPLRTRP
jgi:hypothetical protein